MYANRALTDYCKNGEPRVDDVSTRSPLDRFANGLHVGSSETLLKRRFKDVECGKPDTHLCTLIRCYCGKPRRASDYDYNMIFHIKGHRIRGITLHLGYGA
jgi:hypothetical protein